MPGASPASDATNGSATSDPDTLPDNETTTMTPTEPGSAPRKSVRRIFFIALIAAVAAVGGLALLVNIFERKQEAKNPFYRVVELTDTIDDPAVWGKNFPLQYDGYLRTVDQQRTRFGGSEAVPHAPTQADPRS